MNALVQDTKESKKPASISWFQQCVHRSRNEVFTEVKTITPQMAEVMLLNNPDNRKIREYKLMQMVHDMRDGRWSFNGEPIIVAKTGELNDGQHRLKAVVASGKSVPMLFVFGVDRDTRTTVDQGAPRNAGDYLGMEGVPNAVQMAALARQLIAYEQADRNLGRTNNISAAETLNRIAKDNRLITAAAKYGINSARKVRGIANVTTVGFCYYLFANIDFQDCVAFMNQFVTGEELHTGDPALTARNRLMQLTGRRGRLIEAEIIFRAWNAYRERRQMKWIPIRGQLPELV